MRFGRPERLKPRDISIEGLRMLCPHMVDETLNYFFCCYYSAKNEQMYI